MILTKEEIIEALNERHSPEKQKLLSEGHVAVAGLGGLGSNVAYALARIGVGHLHLIDFDVVDITNLNRQQYFIDQIGMYKTDALKSLLERINPYLDIRTDTVKVTEENLQELFADAPIVCEAFDRPEAKAMLVNGILEHFPEKKLVSATGMAGYGSSNTIRTQRLMKNFYLCGDRVSEPEYGRGLMAARVAVCAAHEANMITRLLLGKEDVAEKVFKEQTDKLDKVLTADKTDKTVAFFYINSVGAVNIRKSGDYVSEMISLAGGNYVPEDTGVNDNALSTMNMQMEEFYAKAKDADYIIYNSTIDGELKTIDELLSKSKLLADFKAVKNGNVWCTGKNLFQETTGLGTMIEDIHTMLTTDDDSLDELTYMHKLK